MKQATAIVSIDFVQKSSDVDAAVYLLERILGSKNPRLDAKRMELARMMRQIRRSRAINPDERREIVQVYKEMMT